MKKKDLKKATEILDRKAEKKQKRKAKKGYKKTQKRMKEIREWHAMPEEDKIHDTAEQFVLFMRRYGHDARAKRCIS